MRTVGARVDLKLVLGEKVDLFGPQVLVDLRPQRHAVQTEIGVEHQVNDRRAVRAISVGVLQVLRFVLDFTMAAVVKCQFGTLKKEYRRGRGEEDLNENFAGIESDHGENGPEAKEPDSGYRCVQIDQRRCEECHDEEPKPRFGSLLDESHHPPDQGERKHGYGYLGTKERIAIEVEKIEETGPQRDNPHAMREPAIARSFVLHSHSDLPPEPGEVGGTWLRCAKRSGMG